ncbi:MAG: hypothetical protein KDA52_21175 [Planctomycetaceae bacterium]|nr:hypothetical protein [Planctomycetaceae bacterium]
MVARNRRQFLEEVGRGMLVASVGTATAVDLGLMRSLQAAEADETRLRFGALEPLVSLMQETSPESLLPLLVDRLRQGTSLQTVVSAAALANARAFGGQDYTGYHTLMALVPAYQMSKLLPAERQALPVLKVVHRNASRIQEQDAHHHDTLHVVPRRSPVDAVDAGRQLRDSVHAVDWDRAESQFAQIASGPVGEAFNHLQFAVQDEVDVHRVVLAWRSWSLLDLTGQEHAHSLLRQSVRYCLQVESSINERNYPRCSIRELLPTLLDQHDLMDRLTGTRPADDSWIEELAHVIFTGTREQGATAVAAALSEGFDQEDVGAAISLAANLLVLHDPGRIERYSTPVKPPGCVHGDSVGVHASDAANAWRQIARVSNQRNQLASLIVAGYHTAGQQELVTSSPYPYFSQLEEVTSIGGPALLDDLDEAIRSNDQARACAVAHRYGEQNLAPRPLFDLLLKYAVSEEGALHAEKYFQTVSEEFATARPAFRWRQAVALARVTASEYGFPSPGYHQACELLGVT